MSPVLSVRGARGRKSHDGGIACTGGGIHGGQPQIAVRSTVPHSGRHIQFCPSMAAARGTPYMVLPFFRHCSQWFRVFNGYTTGAPEECLRRVAVEHVRHAVRSRALLPRSTQLVHIEPLPGSSRTVYGCFV